MFPTKHRSFIFTAIIILFCITILSFLYLRFVKNPWVDSSETSTNSTSTNTFNDFNQSFPSEIIIKETNTRPTTATITNWKMLYNEFVPDGSGGKKAYLHSFNNDSNELVGEYSFKDYKTSEYFQDKVSGSIIRILAKTSDKYCSIEKAVPPEYKYEEVTTVECDSQFPISSVQISTNGKYLYFKQLLDINFPVKSVMKLLDLNTKKLEEIKINRSKVRVHSILDDRQLIFLQDNDTLEYIFYDWRKGEEVYRFKLPSSQSVVSLLPDASGFLLFDDNTRAAKVYYFESKKSVLVYTWPNDGTIINPIVLNDRIIFLENVFFNEKINVFDLNSKSINEESHRLEPALKQIGDRSYGYRFFEFSTSEVPKSQYFYILDVETMKFTKQTRSN